MIRTHRQQPKPSSLYDVFWRFAAERQRMFRTRLTHPAPPWTDDEILATFRFTNVYRVTDRVSQYLVRIQYSDQSQQPVAIVFRTLLFKLFNKIETWEALQARFGDLHPDDFDVTAYASELARIRSEGTSIYSAAYIMPPPMRGCFKHEGHLRLLERMLADDLPGRLIDEPSLAGVYERLLAYPGIGPFLAFQYAIDLNYSATMTHSEMEFVVAGPGALDGLSKCFVSLGEYAPADVIRWMTERQSKEFERLGLDFQGLWGRPMQLIDVQNVLCEISKYTRVSHPEVAGRSGRTRIKRRFTPKGELARPTFPPRWGITQGTGTPTTGASSQDAGIS